LAASALIAWSLITLYSSPGLEEFPAEEEIEEEAETPAGEVEAEEAETKEEKGAAKTPPATPAPAEKK
ncbi:MAG: hypothetical protein HY610_03020, partial [Elusimicrobia bacterium]|nr:hypothetical protein [Elusimicrobiota bacterium]